MPQSFIHPLTQKAAFNAVPSSPAYCLKDHQLEDGLILRHMVFSELSEETISYLLSTNLELEDYFFTFCPDKETGKKLLEYYAINNQGPIKRFFYSEAVQKKPGVEKEIFVFIISNNWINKNYRFSADDFATFISLLPLLFDIAEIPTLMKIDLLYHLKTIKVCVDKEQNAAILRLRVSVLTLIEKFFSNADFSELNNPAPKKHSYTKEMQELGARLSMFLKTTLPDLIVFAREYNMSLSSLKRHFKSVHGKPIYEYYLEQKMILAKSIIETSSRSVTEVAYELGYEDPKSLIKSFKKVFGVAPKKLCA
jgi:AraC-like DNA-binding protein